MTQVVKFISWWATIFGISLKLFLLWLPNRTDQVLTPTAVNVFCLFVCLFLFCFVDGYVTRSHLYCLHEVSVEDIKSVLSQVFKKIHTHIHIFKYIYIYIYIYTHTYSHSHTSTHLHTYSFAWSIIWLSFGKI